LLGGCVFPLGGAQKGADDAQGTGGLEDDSTRDLRAGGTLRFASHWPYSIDPFYLQELSGIQIASCLFDPLLRYDYREQKLIGAAAKNWKVSEQGTLFTFELVEGGRFHNGKAVTAADFKYSWERLFKGDSLDTPSTSDTLSTSGTPSANALYISMIQGAEEVMAGEADTLSGIRVVDELTLEVALSVPFFEFCQVVSYPAFAPIPPLEEVDNILGFDGMPIGNGAFRVEDTWDWEQSALKLVRFDDYQGTLPLLQAVEFRFFVSDAQPGSAGGSTGDIWTVAERHRGGTGGRFRTSESLLRVAEGLPSATKGLSPATRGWPGVAIDRSQSAGSLLRFAGGGLRPAGSLLRPAGSLLRPAGGGLETVDTQFRTYEEKTYEALQDGDLDVAQIPRGEFDDARARYGESEDGYTAMPGAQVLMGQEACTQFLWVNFNREPLTDAAVRRALSCAINREAICAELYRDIASPATGIVPPGIEGFREKAWLAATYDVDKAKQALEDAGYPAGKGLGTITLVTSGTEDENRLFELIQKDLEAVGFAVRLSEATTTELFWNTLERSASLTLSGWIVDFPIMENFLTPLFMSTGSGNQFGYSNVEVDEGIIAARALANDAERIGAYREIENIVSADMPVIPLFYTRHSLVCSDRTNGLYIGPDEIADFSKAWLSY
jgi:ABC-type transport system substrate-binding protein